MPQKLTKEEILARFVTYSDLNPCRTAFIDARTPGNDRKENFTIIGPGVAENPDQHVHIEIPHGFNIGGARQPAGCVNSLHSHETEEVFFVHKGVWVFTWGHNGKDGSVILAEGDTISIPTNVFRGFECIKGEDSFLYAVLGGDDPGHVIWAPAVLEKAKKHGLVLLENGALIDTKAGQKVPDDAVLYKAITDAEAQHSFDVPTAAEMESRIVRYDLLGNAKKGSLCSKVPGLSEDLIIGPASPQEGLAAAPIFVEHGFHVRYITLRPGVTIPSHSRQEEEVVFVHKGALEFISDEVNFTLGVGDTFSVPKQLNHSWKTSTNSACELLVVRGTNTPHAPYWS